MESIFDVFQDMYGKKHSFSSNPYVSSHLATVRVPKLFVQSRIKKNLKIEQRIIVFQLMMAIKNAIDIEPSEPLIF